MMLVIKAAEILEYNHLEVIHPYYPSHKVLMSKFRADHHQ
jgi:hypothetical protein